MSKKNLIIAIIVSVIGSSFAAFSGESLKALETSSDLSYKFSAQSNPSKLKKFLALALLLSHRSHPPKFSSNSASPLKKKKLND